MSDYSPVETKPQYRRFRIKSCDASSEQRITVLGRIRLKDHYSDNDLIPFDNIYALTTAAQSIYSNYNDNVEVAAAKDNTLVTLINRENEHKRVQNGQPIEVFTPLSPGSIVNIVGSFNSFYRYK